MKQANRPKRTWPHMWPRMAMLSTLGVLTLGYGDACLAQSRVQIDKLEEAIRAKQGRVGDLERSSKRLANEIEGLQRQLVEAGRAIQESEAELTQLDSELATTQAELAAKEAALAGRGRQMAGTISVLERISRNPPQALLLSEGKPVEVIRAAMLLRAALPTIHERTETLRTELASLNASRETLHEQRNTRAKAAEEYDARRAELEALLARKSLTLTANEAERKKLERQAAKLADEAKTLKELFSRLEAERPPPPPEAAPRQQASPTPPPAPTPPSRGETPPAAERSDEPVRTAALTPPKPEFMRPFPEQGTIIFPARGEITQRYGESTGFGNTAKGVTIETRNAAQIVAPHDGRVVFAGPFRGYGEILIIEHGGGYHSLIAGLARVYGQVGQWLLAGEPVGAMAELANEAPQLYFELRREGQPVNPTPWFADQRKNTRG